MKSVNVIIPTRCDSARAHVLLRAIDSVVSQTGARGVPIVAVNGTGYDPSLLNALKARQDIRTVFHETPGPFTARRSAFERVDTEFFALLDDDDILLPGALRHRLAPTESDSTVDVVVSNGFIASPTGENLLFGNIEAIRRDPAGTLLESNWLSSAGGLFRTAAVEPHCFDAVRSMEITYLAFWLLAMRRRFAFIDEPTFRYFDHPVSLSKEDHWKLPEADALRAMKALPLPSRVKRGLARKYRRALHNLAEYHRKRHARREAWAAHVGSLAGFPEFFSHLIYTRKLMAG